MAVWVWLAAYLIGVVALQLVLYRYFRDDSTRDRTHQPGEHAGARTDAGADTRTDPGTDVWPETDAEAVESGDDRVHCQHCGAPNEGVTTFTYCRRCTEPLR